MNDSEGTAARLRSLVHHVDLTVRDMAASAPFYEALLGFLGYARVKQEAGLHAWDLVRDGHGVGGVALRSGRARDHPRRACGVPAIRGGLPCRVRHRPDGLELEVVHFVT